MDAISFIFGGGLLILGICSTIYDLIKINKLSNAWKEKVKKDLGVDLE